MASILDIKKLIETQIHGKEVFGPNYIPPENMKEDLHGWFAGENIYDQIIDSFQPNMIIEVGTWKGRSAIHMTKQMKKHKPECFTICVDTWLGSYEHRTNPQWRDELNLQNGHPRLYEQFLFNVHSHGLTENILPIPLPSDQAAHVLKLLNIKVPFIYIDAGHDEFNVRADIEHYWDLLLPGGAMLGDDYNEKLWPGLIKAVHDFEKQKQNEIQGQIKIVDGKWLALKT